MQSLRQYQRLGRRLRQEYATAREKSTGFSGRYTASTSFSTVETGTRDLETANNVRNPVQVDGLGNADPISIQPPNIGPDPLKTTASRLDSAITLSNISPDPLRLTASPLDSAITLANISPGPPRSTASALNSAITLAKSFGGVDLRQHLIPGKEESTIYIVGLAEDEYDLNPRKWNLSLKIWATCEFSCSFCPFTLVLGGKMLIK